MNALISFFIGFKGWFDWALRALVGFYKKQFQLWWLVLVLAASWAWALVTHMNDMLTMLSDSLAAITPEQINLTPPAAVGQVMAIANTFFPMNEAIAFTISYAALKIALTAIRFIKGFIPTLSGS
jgi:hypothetical protein